MQVELSKRDKITLHKAIDERALELMQSIASALLSNWASGTIVRESVFETMKEAIGRDERKRALVSFLKELERLAHE